jgi:A/G-specific adenine glycosylase
MKQLPANNKTLSKALTTWFKASARHLPWRQNRTAYRVWLSEIMLQQTQVTTVQSYYEKFIQRFPTVHDLAQAPRDEVLGMWAGLGYYSRARNLHKTAQKVSFECGGIFPKTETGLRGLPGIGPYTSGAITTLAYNQPSGMVDGNIARVLTRLAEEKSPINQSLGQKWLEKNTYALLSSHVSPRAVGEGLMELGALVCLPNNPHCTQCPFASYCKAYQNQSTHLYPQKIKKLKIKKMQQVALLIQTPRSILLQKQPQKGLFAGLYTLPFINVQAQQTWVQAQEELCLKMGVSRHDIQWNEAPVTRKLTHRELQITCGQILLPKQKSLPGEWHPRKNLAVLGISTAMVRVMCRTSPQLGQNFGDRLAKR